MSKKEFLSGSQLARLSGAVLDPRIPATREWPEKESGKATRDSEFVPIQPPDPLKSLPEVVVFEHVNFAGAMWRTNLNWYYVGDWWNDRISSIIVVSGVWRFYQDWHYSGRYWDLRPAYYPWVGVPGIPNDSISSFRFIDF